VGDPPSLVSPVYSAALSFLLLWADLLHWCLPTLLWLISVSLCRLIVAALCLPLGNLSMSSASSFSLEFVSCTVLVLCNVCITAPPGLGIFFTTWNLFPYDTHWTLTLVLISRHTHWTQSDTLTGILTDILTGRLYRHTDWYTHTGTQLTHSLEHIHWYTTDTLTGTQTDTLTGIHTDILTGTQTLDQ